MKICGFQKLTLLDYPGNLAAAVFLGGCNFRCPFCHNRDLLVPKEFLDEEQVLSTLKKRAGILEGVCITGGEPTLQAGLKNFIITLKDMGFLVKLDTNGYRPEVLTDLCDDGLIDYVAMDIKSSKERYGEAAGIPTLQLPRIEKSVSYLLHGHTPYEFRTTVVPGLHTEEDFLHISRWLAGASSYYLQAYRDSENVWDRRFSSPSNEWMEELRDLVLPLVPSVALRGL